jgi:ubiquinone/menaquinone biosynthesis C-methylase UbiE
MSGAVDYDDRLYCGYQAGRELSHDAASAWRATLVRWLPPRRPLSVLELGSGTGRFSRLIAEVTGGPVYAAEPSHRMRTIAALEHPHPAVHYLAGGAEAIPLAAASCDAVMMFVVLDHIADMEAAAVELSRVLRPGGRVLVAGSFSGRLHPRGYYHSMPRTREIEAEVFPTLATTTVVFESAGLTVTGLVEVEHQIADSLMAYRARLGYRAVSTFEHLTEDELNEGLLRLSADAAVESEPHPVRHVQDLLTLSLALNALALRTYKMGLWDASFATYGD